MRERWLDEGLRVLSELGINGVRIDRLADRLGLTKGSFYHHFPGMAGYRLALLDHFERTYTTRYIDLVEQAELPDARDKLWALIEAVSAELSDDNLEVAIRGWAAKDDDARATLERVDQTRIEYLAGLLLAMHPERDDSLLLSHILYLTLIGARHVVPPLPVKEIRRMYGWLLALTEAPTRTG